MKKALPSLVVMTVLSILACSPKTSSDVAGSNSDKFVKEHFQSATKAYKRAYGGEVTQEQVRAMPQKEFVAFVSDRGWGKAGIPCEISDAIGGRPGVTDPSPIALEVTPSNPGERVVFLPLNPKSNCKNKRDFFVPVAGCSHGWDDVEIQCDGQTSDSKTCADSCICRAVCGEGNDNCTPCD